MTHILRTQNLPFLMVLGSKGRCFFPKKSFPWIFNNPTLDDRILQLLLFDRKTGVWTTTLAPFFWGSQSLTCGWWFFVSSLCGESWRGSTPLPSLKITVRPLKIGGWETKMLVWGVEDGPLPVTNGVITPMNEWPYKWAAWSYNPMCNWYGPGHLVERGYVLLLSKKLSKVVVFSRNFFQIHRFIQSATQKRRFLDVFFQRLSLSPQQLTRYLKHCWNMNFKKTTFLKGAIIVPTI